MFSKSKVHKHLVTYRTKQLLGVEDRQVKLKGFNQEALATAKVILIGAGGLGGEIGEALVRKGVGKLILIDFDLVEITNLNRQRFTKKDLGKPKAHRLAANLANEGFLGSTLIGYSVSFQDALAMGVDLSAAVVVCGVDNNPCRIAVSRYYRERQTPVVFTAVSEDASCGYSFVQQAAADTACFACLFPPAVQDETYHPCSPGITDILKVVGGMVSYAVDSLLMERLRTYNYKTVCLDGTIPGKDWLVPRRPDCQLCGTPHEEQQPPRSPETIGVSSGQSEGWR